MKLGGNVSGDHSRKRKSRRESLRDGFPFPEGSSENKTAAIAGGRFSLAKLGASRKRSS